MTPTRTQHVFILSLVLLGTTLLAGCQSQHARDREAALQRWNHARAEIKARLAEERFQAGNIKAAAEELAAASRLAPDNPALWPLQIKVALAEGRLQDADKLLQQARRELPPDAELEYLLGVVRQQQERWNEALSAYRRAAKLAPDQVAYVTAAAQVCLQVGKPAEALKLLEESSGSFEWTNAYQDVLGECYAQLGDWSAAARAWRRVANGPQADADVRERLAGALFHSGQYAEAIGVLSALLNEGPEEQAEPLRLMLAECYLATGQVEPARATVQRVLQRRRNWPPALRLLARCLVTSGDWQAAWRVVQQALDLGDDDPLTLELAAALAWRLGDRATATDLARRLSRLQPGSPAADLILARTRDG